MNRPSFRQIRIFFAGFFFFLTLLCLLSGSERMARMMFYQPGPLFVRMASTFTVAGMLLVLWLLGTAFFFGRYFCAAVCPLGILQDVIGSVGKSSKARVPNIKKLRYGVAIFSFLLLWGGWAVGFQFFDPFSRFVSITSAALAVFSGSLLREPTFTAFALLFSGLLPFILLAVLVFWKKRIYCTVLCPVGTVLGLCAKYGFFRMGINDACDGCQLCEHSCPTSCIDSQARKIDNERCVRCMNCISCCPRNALTFSRQSIGGSNTNLSFSAARRAFLVRGFSFSAGALLAGHVLSGPIRALVHYGKRLRGILLPPGAIDTERFARACTSCQLCVINCPQRIIKPSTYVFGPVHLDYTHAGCQYDCVHCASICPSGALQNLTLEDKQWLKIGEAVFDASKCRIVKDGTPCGLCASACPKEAILFFNETSSGLGIPEVAVFHCIGCGACQAACPQSPKAIYVEGIEQEMMM